MIRLAFSGTRDFVYREKREREREGGGGEGGREEEECSVRG